MVESDAMSSIVTSRGQIKLVQGGIYILLLEPIYWNFQRITYKSQMIVSE